MDCKHCLIIILYELVDVHILVFDVQHRLLMFMQMSFLRNLDGGKVLNNVVIIPSFLPS